MAIIQISKIILRKGPQTDLPGAPTSLSPLTFAPGLDAAEMAFATDTGRLFVGHDPDEGHRNFERQTFPYQNIEVLTENSGTLIHDMMGSYQRTGSKKSFTHANLPAAPSVWTNVIIPRTGDATYVHRIEFGDSVTAILEYAVYDEDEKPIRQGTITVNHVDGASEPMVMDQAQVHRRLDLTNPDNFNPEKVYNLVEFRFVVAGSVGSEYLAFQYKNRTPGMVYLRFKTTLPEV